MATQSSAARHASLVVAIGVLLVVPAGVTLWTVAHPATLQPPSDNPTPLGYTWSLLLFLVPIAGLA